MKNILIEGSNATGKSTALNYIREIYPESTFIEFHDFYHEHVLNQLNITKLHEPEHWIGLSPEQKIQIEKYLQKRNDYIFSFIKNQLANRIVIERLLITHAVYSLLIMNRDISEYLLSKQEEINNSNMVVLLITCDNDVLRNILEENIRTKPGRNAPTSQYHLKSVDIGLKKNELYNEYFNKLTNVEKVVVKNHGYSTDELKKEIEKALLTLEV